MMVSELHSKCTSNHYLIMLYTNPIPKLSECGLLLAACAARSEEGERDWLGVRAELRQRLGRLRARAESRRLGEKAESAKARSGRGHFYIAPALSASELSAMI